MALSPLLTDFDYSLTNSLQQQDINRRERIYKEKNALLTDPEKLDKVIAGTIEPFVPTNKKIKYNKFNSKLEAIDDAIGSSHPMAGVAGKIKEEFSKELVNPENQYKPAHQILADATKKTLFVSEDGREEPLLIKAYTEKMQSDKSITNWLGAFGEDKSLKKLPGYDEWYQKKMEEPAEPGSFGELATSIGIGAGIGAAGGAAGAAGFGALPGAVVGAVGGALAYGASRFIRGSEYGKAMKDTWELEGADLLLSSIGGLGAEALAAKGLKVAVAKAVEHNLFTEGMRNELLNNPTLGNIIRNKEWEKFDKFERAATRAKLSQELSRENIFNIAKEVQDLKLQNLRIKSGLRNTGFEKIEQGLLEYKPNPEAAGPPGKLFGTDVKPLVEEPAEKLYAGGLSPSERGRFGSLKNFMEGNVGPATNEGLMKAFTDISDIGANEVLRRAGVTNDLFSAIKQVQREEALLKEVAAYNKVMAEGFTKQSGESILQPTNELFGQGTRGAYKLPGEGRNTELYAAKVNAGKTPSQMDTFRRYLETQGYDEDKLAGFTNFKQLKMLYDTTQKTNQELRLGIQSIADDVSKTSKIDVSLQQKLSRDLTDGEKWFEGFDWTKVGKAKGPTTAGIAGIGLLGLSEVFGPEDANAATGAQVYRGVLKAMQVEGRKLAPEVMEQLKWRLRNAIPAEAYASVNKVKPFNEVYPDMIELIEKKYNEGVFGADKAMELATKALDYSENTQIAAAYNKGLQNIYLRPTETGFYALEHEMGHHVLDAVVPARGDLFSSTVRDALKKEFETTNQAVFKDVQKTLGASIHNSSEAFAEGFRLKLQNPALYDAIYPANFKPYIDAVVDDLIASSKLGIKNADGVLDVEATKAFEESMMSPLLKVWHEEPPPTQNFVLFEKNPPAKLLERDGVDYAGEMLKGLVIAIPALAGSVLLSDLISPSSAEASVASTISNKIPVAVAKTMGDIAGDSDARVLGLLTKMKRAGYIPEVVADGQKTMPLQAQRALRIKDLMGEGDLGNTPWDFAQIKEIVGKTKSKADGFFKASSPYTFGRWYGKEGHNIAVELATMQNGIENNTLNGLKVIDNILKDVKGINKANRQIILDEMKQLSPELDEVFVASRIADSEYGVQSKMLKRLEATLEKMDKKGVDGSVIEEKIAGVKEKMTQLQRWQNELRPKFAEANQAWETKVKSLAQRFSETRISLAAEDTADFQRYPWLKNLMKADEMQAVDLLKAVHQNYAERMMAVNEKVLSEPFVHHSTFRSALSTKNLEERLSKMGIDPTKSIPYAKFHHRGIFSKQMIPDIVRNMTDYIPDAEKRIMGADFWRVGQKSGWDAVRRSALVQSSDAWRGFFDRLADSMVPMQPTLMNKASNLYTTLETIRLLSFSPSAALKHLFKVEGTWATMGFGYSMKHLGESVTMAASNAVRNSIEAGGVASKLGLKEFSGNEIHDLGRALVRQRSMLNALSDLEVNPVVRGGVERFINSVSEVTGVGIKAVENFDRAHSFLAAIHMAANKGMTEQQALYAVFDNILKNNFLGGALNPSWMRNPKIRMLALFQNTPFKILERRVVNALKSGEALKTAWGVMKEQGLQQTLKDLAGIRAAVKEGESEFKRNLIYDALTSQKDFFGTPVIVQTMKEMLVAGAVITGGSTVGMDFWPQTWHTPFMQVGAKSPTIAVSPIVGAAYGAATGKGASEGAEAADESFGVVSRFLQQWLGPQGVKPLLLHKMERLSENDIPEIYKGSKWQYLFSIPATKGE